MLSVAEPHIGDHAQCFTDAHIVMAACGASKEDMAARMLKSMRDIIQ